MTVRKPPTKPSSTKKPTSTNKLPSETAHGSATPAAPQSVDEATGAASLKRVMPLLLAIPPAEVVVPPLNLRAAALVALGVCQLIESRGLRARIEAQAKLGELDIAQLDRLPDLARAAFVTRLRVEQESAVASEAMVPVALATRAQQQRRSMLKLLDFYFEDDQIVAPKLAFIRSGTGYQDLAEDLLGLVALYREHEATLKQSLSHYQASAEKYAANLAAELMSWLGGGAAEGADNAEGVSSSQLASRAGQLMVRAYDEVAEVARYLCRRDPALAARFQSLYALTRSRTSSASDSEPAPADGEAGAPSADGTQPAA